MSYPASRRRDFLNWVLGSSLGTLVLWVLYPVLRFFDTPVVPESTAAQVEAGATNDLAFQQTGYKIVRFGGNLGDKEALMAFFEEHAAAPAADADAAAMADDAADSLVLAGDDHFEAKVLESTAP